MRLIIGASSRVAQRFVALTPEIPTLSVGRREVSDWLKPGGSAELDEFLGRSGIDWDDVNIFTGITDPKAHADDLEAVNVQLPRLFLSRAEAFGFAVTTYGTALEVLSPAPTAYVASKQRLFDLIERSRGGGVDAMHIRFHTVFGASVPQPHMFLGQMLTALVSGDDFRMSSGTQFREYQHVDDIAAAIQIVNSNRDRGAVTIAHGQPIQLGELAQRVFESFDRLDSLKIGALPDQVPDVTAPLGGQLPELATLSFRDTIPAVIDYMHAAARVNRVPEE